MINKDKIILQKIIAYIEDVYQYVHGFDFDSFLKDKKTVSACAFTISQIGELASKLSENIQSANHDIPWKSIRGMRNKIVHDYEKIDFTVLWGTIDISLPELKNQLIKITEDL